MEWMRGFLGLVTLVILVGCSDPAPTSNKPRPPIFPAKARVSLQDKIEELDKQIEASAQNEAELAKLTKKRQAMEKMLKVMKKSDQRSKNPKTP